MAKDIKPKKIDLKKLKVILERYPVNSDLLINEVERFNVGYFHSLELDKLNINSQLRQANKVLKEIFKNESEGKKVKSISIKYTGKIKGVTIEQKFLIDHIFRALETYRPGVRERNETTVTKEIIRFAFILYTDHCKKITGHNAKCKFIAKIISEVTEYYTKTYNTNYFVTLLKALNTYKQ